MQNNSWSQSRILRSWSEPPGTLHAHVTSLTNPFHIEIEMVEPAHVTPLTNRCHIGMGDPAHETPHANVSPLTSPCCMLV